jgi:two-component system sensor histidine kinase TctE
LHAILKSEQRASHLIDQLLDLAYAEEAGNRLSMHGVRVDILAQEAMLKFAVRADHENVLWEARGLETPTTAWAHEQLLCCILDNLIDNAFRYGKSTVAKTDTASEHRVVLSLEEKSAHVWLSVTDSGHGLPQDWQDNLARRWQQGRLGQALGLGSGLGLAIITQYSQILRARIVYQQTPFGAKMSVVLAKTALADTPAPSV